MNDQEKSVMLAKVLEWSISEPYENNMGDMVVAVSTPHGAHNNVWAGCEGVDDDTYFYDVGSMDLVWWVLNWAWEQHDRMVVSLNEESGEYEVEPLKYWTWRLMNVLWEAGRMNPYKAVRHILDSILELAINAGKVEADA